MKAAVPNVHLGEIATTIRGVTYKKTEATDQPAAYFVPILRATNISTTLDFENLVYVPERVVKPGQRLQQGDIILAASSGSLNVVGKAARLKQDWDGSFGAFCYAVRPDPSRVRPRYLELFMQTPAYRRRVAELAAGTNINNLKREHIESFEVPLPALAIQDLLVGEVEKQLTRLDASVGALTRGRANLNRYWIGTLQSSLDRAERIGSKTRTVNSLVASGRKVAYGVLQPGPHIDGGIPLVRVKDVVGGRLELHDGIKRIAPEISAKYPRTLLRGGELLLTIVGTIGRVAVVGRTLRGANVARAVAVLPMSETVNPFFMMHVLANPRSVAQLNRSAHEVARKTLNLEDVREFAVQVPEAETQTAVALHLEALLSVVNRLRTQIRKDVARAERLRMSILSDAFSGRLFKEST